MQAIAPQPTMALADVATATDVETTSDSLITVQAFHVVDSIIVKTAQPLKVVLHAHLVYWVISMVTTAATALLNTTTATAINNRITTRALRVT